MVHQRRNNVTRLGTLFTPRDLFGPRSLLARRTRAHHVAGVPKRIENVGRPAWSVDLESSTGITTVMVIDDRTSIISGLSSPDHNQSLHLGDLVEHIELPDSWFVWDGHAIDSNESRSFGMSWWQEAADVANPPAYRKTPQCRISRLPEH